MGGDQGSWPFLFAMLAVTFGGIFVISDTHRPADQRHRDQARGAAQGPQVWSEKDHTLILGWSPKIFTIISELAIAGEDRARRCVVVLADKDKVEMEAEIRTKVRQAEEREGDLPARPADRPRRPGDRQPGRSARDHRLAQEGGDADTHVLKTILALTNNPDRKAGRYHIVAELRDPKKQEVAKLIGGDELEIVLSSEVVTRLTVQTCFQSGLSIVYTELFDFAGDEIYLKTEPKLVGKTFGEALLAYDTCAVIGMRRSDGTIRLNPPMETPSSPSRTSSSRSPRTTTRCAWQRRRRRRGGDPHRRPRREGAPRAHLGPRLEPRARW